MAKTPKGFIKIRATKAGTFEVSGKGEFNGSVDDVRMIVPDNDETALAYLSELDTIVYGDDGEKITLTGPTAAAAIVGKLRVLEGVRGQVRGGKIDATTKAVNDALNVTALAPSERGGFRRAEPVSEDAVDTRAEELIGEGLDPVAAFKQAFRELGGMK